MSQRRGQQLNAGNAGICTGQGQHARRTALQQVATADHKQQGLPAARGGLEGGGRTEGQRSSRSWLPSCASMLQPLGDDPAGRHCQRPKVTQEPSCRKDVLPTSALVTTPTVPSVAAAMIKHAHRHCTASQRRAPRWPRRARGASDGTGSAKKPKAGG